MNNTTLIYEKVLNIIGDENRIKRDELLKVRIGIGTFLPLSTLPDEMISGEDRNKEETQSQYDTNNPSHSLFAFSFIC